MFKIGSQKAGNDIINIGTEIKIGTQETKENIAAEEDVGKEEL